jgi:uncharacterized protein YndB with AHSA1/START domain
MAQASTGNVTETTTLRLTRAFAARRERVFRALTQPEDLTAWFGPSDEYATAGVDVDLRVGGHYSIALRTPSGEVIRVGGTYREVLAPSRLVFTWQWEGNPNETLVTIDLVEVGDRTELRLTHERFADAAERDRHGGGWSGSLERLDRRLGTERA